VERVVIVGSGGAGKSTLAVRLGRALDLPVIHLDREYWQAGWVGRSDEEFDARLEELLARPRWIMDGNFGRTMARRFAAADTIVMLDLPAWRCTWRALQRALKHRGRTRPDMAPGCPERIDLEFLRWIWDYPRRSRPRVMQTIEAARQGRRVVILRSEAEVAEFLARPHSGGGTAP
jgi:adenylate kinase family enzyme